MKSNVGFRLAYLNLTLAYSKGQICSWNGVLPNILTFLSGLGQCWFLFFYQTIVRYGSYHGRMAFTRSSSDRMASSFWEVLIEYSLVNKTPILLLSERMARDLSRVKLVWLELFEITWYTVNLRHLLKSKTTNNFNCITYKYLLLW